MNAVTVPSPLGDSKMSPLSALLSLIAIALTSSDSFAHSVTAIIDQSGTNVTTELQRPVSPFGNSVEPGGAWSITVAQGGAATLMDIKTQLYKKVGLNCVPQGGLVTATTTGNSWSCVRYSQLAAGEYKVEAILSYTQTNPVPARANPQKKSVDWTGAFAGNGLGGD